MMSAVSGGVVFGRKIARSVGPSPSEGGPFRAQSVKFLSRVLSHDSVRSIRPRRRLEREHRIVALRSLKGELDPRGGLLQDGGNTEDSPLATLNIKNLPDALYRKLQARAKRERRSVAQEVTQILSVALETPKPLSILDLRGLGKEHWEGKDAAAHVDDERAAWD
jgi:hypothetical protein